MTRKYKLASLALAIFLPTFAYGQPIQIGQTLPLTGSGSEAAKNMMSGAQVYLKSVNQSGGIRGRPIELVSLDDQASSVKAVENANNLLLNRQVLAMFSGFHGGTCAALAKWASEKRVPLIACASGTPALREPNPFLFPVRASHKEEWQHMASLSTALGLRDWVFLYDDNDNGRKHLANLTAALTAQKGTLKGSHALKSPLSEGDINKLALEVVNARPQQVVFQTPYALNAQLIQRIRTLDKSIRFMINNSGAEEMVRILGEQANGLVFTQVVPYPWSFSDELSKRFRADVKFHGGDLVPGFAALEGYLNAAVMVEGLRAAKVLTPEGVADALEQKKKVVIGGFEVPTALPNRGSTFVDIVYVARGGFVR